MSVTIARTIYTVKIFDKNNDATVLKFDTYDKAYKAWSFASEAFNVSSTLIARDDYDRYNSYIDTKIIHHYMDGERVQDVAA